MMRICSPQLGLSPTATLGGEVYDYEILTRLAQTGAAVEVLLPAGLPAPDLPNLRVTRLPLRRGYRWYVSNLYLVPHIGRLYRQQPFDLLRVHSLRFTGLAALWARKVFRLPVPVVAHHHHTDPDRWTQPIDRRVAQQADLLLVGSHATAADVRQRFNTAPGRLAVVPYGIGEQYHPGPSDALRRLRPDLQDKQVILHVGSLITRKNLPTLLHAFAAVLAALPNAHLVLLGGGPAEAELRALAAALGMTQAVELAGRVPEESKLAFYRGADLLVSASLMEGFGLAVGEAMACGLPVVAAASGSLPEIVEDGVSGLLACATDPSALAAAMIRILDDPALAQRLGAAAIQRIDQHFRWARTTEQTFAIYQNLIRTFGAS